MSSEKGACIPYGGKEVLIRVCKTFGFSLCQLTNEPLLGVPCSLLQQLLLKAEYKWKDKMCTCRKVGRYFELLIVATYLDCS